MECAIDPLSASSADGDVPSEVCSVGRSCGELQFGGVNLQLKQTTESIIAENTYTLPAHRGVTLDSFFGSSSDASDFSSSDLSCITSIWRCRLFRAGEGWSSVVSSGASLFLECEEALSSSSSSSSPPSCVDEAATSRDWLHRQILWRRPSLHYKKIHIRDDTCLSQ